MERPSRRPAAGYTERDIIARLRQRFRADQSKVTTGIGDDAAVLPFPGAPGLSQVVTADLLIEGMHFDRRYMGPGDIGYKALAVNLSDIAAMGAVPVAAFGCLGLPAGMRKVEVNQLLDGVAAACNESGITLAGGDTVAAHQLLIGFTVLGTVSGKPLLRSGAKPGDLIWHSGSLGLSTAGWNLLSAGAECPPELAQAHRRPQAQLALGHWLQQEQLASACIDLSDSLSQCLLQLAEASEVGLELDFQEYAFHPALTDGPRATRAQLALAAAEDYQLLFTSRPKHRATIREHAPAEVACLGVVTDMEAGRWVIDERGVLRRLKETGWRHPF